MQVEAGRGHGAQEHVGGPAAGRLLLPLTGSGSNLFLELPHFLPGAAPVGLRHLFVPLAAQGPGLGQGSALLRLPSGPGRLLCGLRAQRGPLQALVQPLFQLVGGGGQKGPEQSQCRNWGRNIRSCLCLEM